MPDPIAPRKQRCILLARTSLIALLSAAQHGHAGEELAALTGHVDLVSRYILRGASSTYGPASPGVGNGGADAPESDRPALQWGADWTHPSGVYFGYWGSQVNYSYLRLGQSYSDRGISDFQSRKSIENDVYGGYNGKINETIGYTLGLTGYLYINGAHANAAETKLGVSIGDVSLNAQTLLRDVVWGNKGDTYWTLNFSRALPYQITLNTSLGYYTYHKQGRFLGSQDTLAGTACPMGQSFSVNGCYDGGAPVGGALRHLSVGFTQAIAGGATWGLQAILGGDNRFGVKQEKRLVANLGYGF